VSREEPSPSASPEYVLPALAAPEDIDEQGRVSNLVYLRYVLDTATAHSRAVGWDHAAYVRQGFVFVVRRHEIDYLGPIYAGDVLAVTTWIKGWSAATSERRTRIVRGVDGVEVARATTLWALVSTTTGKPVRIPKELRDAFLLPAG
jgi:acyl-CoA thioester hydrolase